MQVHFIILNLRIIQMYILEEWTSWSHLRIRPTSLIITIVPVFLSYYYLYSLHLESWFLSTLWSTALSHKTISVLSMSLNSVNHICEQVLFPSTVCFHNTNCLAKPLLFFQDTERLNITSGVFRYNLKFGIVNTVLLGHTISFFN